MVRETSLSDSDRSTPICRPGRWPAVLAVLGVLISGLVAGSMSPAPAAESEISQGSLTWGAKYSFRNYIENGVAAGTITVSEGATRADDGTNAPSIVWPLVSGSHDDETGTTVVQFAGRAVFYGHGGALSMDISNPRIEITSRGSYLYVDVNSKTLDGDWITEEGAELARLDYTAGSYGYDAASDTSDWSGIPAAVTQTGADVFAGFYKVGEALDDVEFSYTGPGSSPPVETEEWTEPGTISYEAGEPVSVPDGFGYYGLSADEKRAYFIEGTRIVVLDLVTGQELGRYDGAFPLLGATNRQAFDPVGETIYYRTQPTAAQDPERPYILSAVTFADGEFTFEEIFRVVDTSSTFSNLAVTWNGDLRTLTWIRATSSAVRVFTEQADGSWDTALTFDTSEYYPAGTTYTAVGDDPRAIIRSWSRRLSVTNQGLLLVTALEQVLERATASSAYALNETDGERPDALVVDPRTAEQSAIPGTASPDPYYNATPSALLRSGGFVLSTSSLGVADTHTVVKVDDDGELVAERVHTGVATAVRGANADGSTLIIQRTGSTAAEVWIDGRHRATLDGVTPSSVSAIGSEGTIWHSNTSTRQLVPYTAGTVSPTITAQPQDATVDATGGSATATFGVEAEADPAAQIQWQTRPAGSTSIYDWTDIDDATESTLSTEVTAADQARQYRAVLSNDAGRIATDVVTVDVRTTPVVGIDARDAAVTEGDEATFQVTSTGNPVAQVVWQRRVGGYWQSIADDDENFTIVSGDGASSLTVQEVNLDQSGSLFRARVRNSVGTAYTRSAKLTVTPKATIPAEGLDLDGVSLDWSGSQELQKAAPNGGSNFFSAGVSDGTQGTYKATEGDVKILQVAAGGQEAAASWATRGAHVTGGGSQLVRLGGGDASVKADGSATVAWDGAFSVNFYGGLVPFTITDPELTVGADGTGTLTADLSGYASSMENPEVKTPLDPIKDATIASFGDVRIDPAGTITVTPDYAGVELEVPVGQQAQDRTVEGWGAWPQEFVDFHFATGLSSYWYSSGGAADPYKAPSTFAVDFTDAKASTPTADVASKTTVSLGRASYRYGSYTTATVKVSASGGTPSGRVTVRTAGRTITRTLKNGAVTVNLPKGLKPGRRTVTVSYLGASGLRGSAASTSFTVTKARLKISAKPVRSRVKASQRARVRVTVSIPGGSNVRPRGQIVIRDGGRIIASKTLKAGHRGKVTVRLPKLSKGKHFLRATISGSSVQSARSTTYKTLTVR